MKFLIDFLAILTHYGPHAYVLIFLALLACGFGLPLPEDIILVTSGILASHGIIDFWWTIVLTMAGVLIGDGTIFIGGKYFGPRLKQTRLFKWLLTQDREVKVQKILKKYGDKVIFMARFMPGLRTPIFFTTGTYQIPLWKFIIFDGIAALISVPLWVYVGYLFGANLEELERVVRKFQYGIYLALAGIIIIFILSKYFRRRVDKETTR